MTPHCTAEGRATFFKATEGGGKEFLGSKPCNKIPTTEIYNFSQFLKCHGIFLGVTAGYILGHDVYAFDFDFPKDNDELKERLVKQWDAYFKGGHSAFGTDLETAVTPSGNRKLFIRAKSKAVAKGMMNQTCPVELYQYADKMHFAEGCDSNHTIVLPSGMTAPIGTTLTRVHTGSRFYVKNRTTDQTNSVVDEVVLTPEFDKSKFLRGMFNEYMERSGQFTEYGSSATKNFFMGALYSTANMLAPIHGYKAAFLLAFTLVSGTINHKNLYRYKYKNILQSKIHFSMHSKQIQQLGSTNKERADLAKIFNEAFPVLLQHSKGGHAKQRDFDLAVLCQGDVLTMKLLAETLYQLMDQAGPYFIQSLGKENAHDCERSHIWTKSWLFKKLVDEVGEVDYRPAKPKKKYKNNELSWLLADRDGTFEYWMMQQERLNKNRPEEKQVTLTVETALFRKDMILTAIDARRTGDWTLFFEKFPKEQIIDHIIVAPEGLFNSSQQLSLPSGKTALIVPPKKEVKPTRGMVSSYKPEGRVTESWGPSSLESWVFTAEIESARQWAR